MNRDQYLNMRNNGQISIPLFYNHYAKKSSKPIDYNSFASLFPMWFKSQEKEVLRNLDCEFGVDVLMDKQGNEIWFN